MTLSLVHLKLFSPHQSRFLRCRCCIRLLLIALEFSIVEARIAKILLLWCLLQLLLTLISLQLLQLHLKVELKLSQILHLRLKLLIGHLLSWNWLLKHWVLLLNWLHFWFWLLFLEVRKLFGGTIG